MTAIIILNWNGADDTIECLKSLESLDTNDFIVTIVDNGSSNSTKKEILTYIKNHWNYLYINQDEEEDLPSNINNKTCLFYALKENYGFAKGNNMGLNLIKRLKPDFCLLLNNDTVVTPDFLSKLVTFNLKNQDYKILTPKILYYWEKDKIWNCGGKLFFGFRKYYYANQDNKDLPNKRFINISFITGCCLFFSYYLIKDENLLTEAFFHGEEDFEFSIRMKENKIKMACVLDSVIYHKVGRSISEDLSINKTYLYYLNRFVNMKNHQSYIKHKIWKTFYLPYLYLLLRKKRLSSSKTIDFIQELLSEAKNKTEVNKTLFLDILNRKF